MPYISQEQRDFIDPQISALVDRIFASNVDGPTGIAGVLNYTISRLLVRTLPTKRYWALALGVGTLVCALLEFYRRYVGKYEDEAIAKNGDIREYQE